MRRNWTKTPRFGGLRFLAVSSLLLGATSLGIIGFAAGSGTDWFLSPSPNIAKEAVYYGDIYIKSITCVTASDCWAVGYSRLPQQGRNVPVIEHWNGSSWTEVDSPSLNSYSASLNGINCVSGSDCWAVGSFLDPDASNNRTLIEHWDGISWTVVPSPNATTQSNVLFSVTCTGASDCWAVGRSDLGTLIERWNGTTWTLVSSPNAGVALYNFLTDVTCNSSSDCWAAGRYLSDVYPEIGDKTLFEHWDGTSWTIVASPNSDPTKYNDNYITGITCTSSSDCWAVGYSQDTRSGNGYVTLIVRWDGTSWAIVNTGLNDPVAIPTDVACSSSLNCWLVGNAGGRSLTARWNGNSWSRVNSPNGDATQYNSLYGVTCVSGTNCWAAGDYHNYQANANQSLIERWNGSSWVIVPSVNPSTTVITSVTNKLEGVTCVSPTDCWSVGYVRDVNYTTLTQHWDGKEWSIVPSPNTASWLNELLAVTCTSSSDCWAVGDSGGYPAQTLIEHWNGASWVIVPSPNGSEPVNILQSVTCPSASDCWAVGYSGDGSTGAYSTLIEHWNGSSWTIVPSPALPTSQPSFLMGVSCPSSSDCWAVGYLNNSETKLDEELIVHWNGVSWERIPTLPANPDVNNYLYGVSCASSSDCWAVGFGGTSPMLVKHWDGTTWSLAPTTADATTTRFLLGVTCPFATECWAVGYQQINNGVQKPLLAEWDGTTWSPIPTPNSITDQQAPLFDVTCWYDSPCWAVGYANDQTASEQTLIIGYAPPTSLYTIVLSASPSAGGVLSGNGRYSPNAEVVVTATPNNGFRFVNWTEQAVIVSTATEYTFLAESNRSLVANFIPVVSTPVISPSGGTFKKKVKVKLSCATGGATIYYTLDGTDPTIASNVYLAGRRNRGFKLKSKGQHTVKAKAVKSGYAESSVAIAHFTIN